MEITIPPTGPFEDGTGPFEDGKGAKASKDTLYWVNARPAMDQFKQAGDAVCTKIQSITHEAVAIALMTVLVTRSYTSQT